MFRERQMAYRRDDEVLAEYNDITKQLEIVRTDITKMRMMLARALNMYREQRSLESRLDAIKVHYPHLQR